MHRNTLFVVAALLLGLGACGRDAAAPAARLTDGEARTLAASMSGVSAGYAGAVSPGGAGVASTLGGPSSWTFTAELKCPAGGTVTPHLEVSAGIDAIAKSATLDLSGTEVSKDCGHAVDGKTITITGDLGFSAHVPVLLGRAGTVTFAEKGTFDWARSDGTKGTCSVDFSGAVDPVSHRTTLTGTFCGLSLS